MDWDIPIAFFYGLAGVYLAYVGVQTVNPGERFLFLAIGAVFVALSVTQAFMSNQDKEALQTQLSAINDKISSNVTPALEPHYLGGVCMDEGVPLLVVLLAINNVGQVKSIADNFQLHLNDSTLAALLIGNERFILHGMIGESSANIDLVLIWNEFIHRRAVNGIGVGEQKRGWLVAEGIKTCSKSHGAQITFKDTVGKRYSLKIDNLEKVPPIPSLDVLSRFPDITYPFRERQWVEKFKRNAGVDSTVVFLSNAK